MFGGETKKVANGSKTAIVIPSVVDPIEIQIALGIVPVEIRAVAIAIRILPDRTIARDIAYATILRILSGLNFIRHRNALISHAKYLYFLKINNQLWHKACPMPFSELLILEFDRSKP